MTEQEQQTLAEVIRRELYALLARLSNGTPPDRRRARKLALWLADGSPHTQAALTHGGARDHRLAGGRPARACRWACRSRGLVQLHRV